MGKIYFSSTPVLALFACVLFSACGKKTSEGAPASQERAANIASSVSETSALTGAYVVNPQFERAVQFSEGLAPVRFGGEDTGKSGFIDKQGKMVVTPQFDIAGKFADGMAFVAIGNYTTGKWGYIRR